jgi:porphobilinogen synthase
VALTGPDGDGGSLGEGLRSLGVETVSAPLLRVEPLAGPLDTAGFDLVAFSSARAVDAVAPGIPCIAVGPGTARRARAAGFTVLIEGEGPGAAGLLEAARRSPGGLAGKRVLLPGSDRARPELAEGLAALGALVEAVDAYAVRPRDDLGRAVGELRALAPDAAVVASPSAAECLAGAPGLPPLFAVGPTTAEAMGRLGLPVAGTAARPTPLGIVTAMKEHGMGGFPVARPRRLRRTEAIRAMVRETRLTPDCLVAPMFVTAGKGKREPVPSMPGVERVSVAAAVEDARALWKRGVRSVLLFGIPGSKDAEGTGASDPEGPVCRAIRGIKEALPELVVWADVCLCEYTDHGHCGVLDERGRVRNDESLPLLARAAVAYAKAGADAVAPSDMMDGRVGAIRTALDREGLTDTLLVSYAVKYASAFYGPFRDAAGSTPKSGDRRAYQMDPANAREALREAALDEAEGADVIMVKPALPYLDVIHRVREATNLPVAAYNVSGEYAMVKAAAERGWIDGDRVILETLTSIRRAGADLVVTYHAAEAARLLG